jgi:hypothetical protein
VPRACTPHIHRLKAEDHQSFHACVTKKLTK